MCQSAILRHSKGARRPPFPDSGEGEIRLRPDFAEALPLVEMAEWSVALTERCDSGPLTARWG